MGLRSFIGLGSARPWQAAPAAWRGGQVGLGILLVVASIYPISGIGIGLGKLAAQFEPAVGVWGSSHLMGFVILVVVWHLGLRPYNGTLSALGLMAPATVRLKTILLTSGVLSASLLSTVLYSRLVDRLDLEILATPDIPADIIFPGPASLLTYEALAIWTPLAEEVFFRGFVFAGLVPRLGVAGAMVASALIFSGFHVSLGLVVPVFITGLLLAWLYYRTGSLWPAIAAHAGQNSLAIATTFFGV